MSGSVVARFVVVDGDGRALVLRQVGTFVALLESIPGMPVVPSFEREGETPTVSVKGQKMSAGYVGAAPTVLTHRQAEGWIVFLKRGRIVDRSEVK